jgi:hypothetical protein
MAGPPVRHHLESCADSPARYCVKWTRPGDGVVTHTDRVYTVTIQNGAKVYRDGAGKVTGREASHDMGQPHDPRVENPRHRL